MDKYDQHIVELKDNPRGIFAIRESWGHAEPLFEYAGDWNRLDRQIGCLTMIRDGSHVAETDELTEAIRADERIPKNAGDITLSDLEVFAEWQRKLDLMPFRQKKEVTK